MPNANSVQFKTDYQMHSLRFQFKSKWGNPNATNRHAFHYFTSMKFFKNMRIFSIEGNYNY